MSYRCAGPFCLADTEDADRLCDICWDYRLVILDRLPNLVIAAHEYLPPTARATERISGGAGPGSRPPLRMSILGTINAVPTTLARWAALFGGKGSTVEELAQACMATDHVVTGKATAVDYFLELWELHHELNAITHTTSESERITDSPCPECGRLAVIARRHAAYMCCLQCGGMWCESVWHHIGRSRSV